jgi:hypothetical protein
LQVSVRFGRISRYLVEGTNSGIKCVTTGVQYKTDCGLCISRHLFEREADDHEASAEEGDTLHECKTGFAKEIKEFMDLNAPTMQLILGRQLRSTYKTMRSVWDASRAAEQSG